MSRTHCYNLPQQDPKGPDIAGRGVDAIFKRLERHPLQRHLAVGQFVVDVFLVHQTSQPEVADFHYFVVSYQDVASCQVAMDVLTLC